MSLYKARAIVLRVIKYHEADKIIHLLSADGRISAIAKGSRKVKSRFGGRIEPFCLVDFVLYEGKNLHTVTQANLVKSYKNIRCDFEKYLSASAAVELVDKVTFGGQNEEAIFDLLDETLSYLDSAAPANPLLLPYFDWQMIKKLGLLPNLSINHQQSTINNLYFNLAGGCLSDEPLSDNNYLKVEPLTIQLLKSIIDVKLEELSNINPSGNTMRQLVYLTEQYMNYQLQTKLKARSYID